MSHNMICTCRARPIPRDLCERHLNCSVAFAVFVRWLYDIKVVSLYCSGRRKGSTGGGRWNNLVARSRVHVSGYRAGATRYAGSMDNLVEYGCLSFEQRCLERAKLVFLNIPPNYRSPSKTEGKVRARIWATEHHDAADASKAVPLSTG